MAKNDPVPELRNPPKVGDVYRHYKGDDYRVQALALDTVTRQWVVVYEPLYESNAALFTRPLSEWNEAVDWDGEQATRFMQVQGAN